MAVPLVGRVAPEIKLIDSNGEKFSLKALRDKHNVVLYFYPKDDTPGCTVQACGFRDSMPKIKTKKAVVIGVSPDGLKKHEKFIDKYELPFLLLCDEDKKACNDYGVWVEKSMYGRKYMGVARTTFIINKKGKIVKVFEKVKPKVHAEEVLESLANDL